MGIHYTPNEEQKQAIENLFVIQTAPVQGVQKFLRDYLEYLKGHLVTGEHSDKEIYKLIGACQVLTDLTEQFNK